MMFLRVVWVRARRWFTARAEEAEREATTTILSLGFAVRPRAGCAFFSALRVARAWPGPSQA